MRSSISFRDAVDQHKQFAALRIAEVLGLNAGQYTPGGSRKVDKLDSVDGAYLEQKEWSVSKTPHAPWDLDSWANTTIGFGSMLSKHMRKKVFQVKSRKDIPPSSILSESDVLSFEEEDVSAMVRDMLPDLTAAIWNAIGALDDPAAGDEESQSSKFTVENGKWIHAEDGGVAQGRLNLLDLTGPPSSELLRGMQAEHCASSDSDSVFTVNSYGGVVTTARLEWDFVAGTEAVLEDGTFYPESTLDMKKSFPDDIGKRPARRGKPGGRERKHISDFVKQEIAKKSGLTYEEALALRLWTGPMHLKYNAVLSGHPKGIEASLGTNKYSTTIHLILRALAKLSPFQQQMQGRKVFVGLHGEAWHSSIWKPDALGFKGAFMRGFISAASNLNTARSLPWKSDQRQIILEVELARTSMAVDVAWISQYPYEQEVLIPAFSYYEVTPVFRFEHGVCVSVARPFTILTADVVSGELEGRKDAAKRLVEKLVWDAKRTANKVDIAGEAEEAHLGPLRSQLQVTAALPMKWFDDLRKFYSAIVTIIELLSSANRQAAEKALNHARAARAIGNTEEAVRSYQSAISIVATGCITEESREAAYEVRKELVSVLDNGSTGLPSLDVAAIKNDLGVDLRQHGDLELALSLCQAALEARTKELGKEHLLVANAMNNTANVLQGMERYEEAVPMYEEALRVTVRLVGREHTNVATQLNNMALLHKKLNKHDRAVQLYRESLELRVRVLGKDHPDTAATLYNLASLFAHKGDRSTAAPMFDRAALIYAASYGPAHPETKDARKKAVLCGVQPAGNAPVATTI